MANLLGYSVFLSTFEKQKSYLQGVGKNHPLVFVSLHIAEEFSDTYTKDMHAMCAWLNEEGFRIVADVSTKSLELFQVSSVREIAKLLDVYALRLDYGFDHAEMLALAKEMPIVLNASTICVDEVEDLVREGKEILAMHNYYPRSETGLDEEYFLKITQSLQAAGIHVIAFIPGDVLKRGPIFEGLPTLEHHRHISPYAAFMELTLKYHVDQVFVGDPGISAYEIQRIQSYCDTGVIDIPVTLKHAEHFYDKEVTCRIDSPSWIIRVEEARLLKKADEHIAPNNTTTREIGAITMDNDAYLRYAGEVQVVRSPLPADNRVNIIGHVSPKDLSILKLVKGGMKIRFVREDM